MGLSHEKLSCRIIYSSFIVVIFHFFAVQAAFADGWDTSSWASNSGSITNTRHNLTMSYLGPNAMFMDSSRNSYGEVCVYCHTPHSANGLIEAPLWNRTYLANSYNLYDKPLSSGQSPTPPGAGSLTCLSCHDGTVAIDSVVNMPGPGGYDPAQQSSINDAFLDSWGTTDNHRTLNGDSSDTNSCLYCHSLTGWIPNRPFDLFAIGLDLSDDHPVGVRLPNPALYDFWNPSGYEKNMRFYDNNGNGYADTNEIRFYDSGDGYEVECSSCHDPHGVPSAGEGSVFIPSFLRVTDQSSAICLACHRK